MSTPSAPVVVAVRPQRSERDVVAWAAREAVRRGVSLVVGALPAVGARGVGFRMAVAEALAAAVDLAHRQQPALEVRMDRVGASGHRHVVALSQEAAVLVMAVDGDEPEPALPAAPLPERLVVHAGCPVVVVPRGAASASRADPRVVAGWAQGRSGRRALAVAADEAASRSTWLTVVSVPLPVDPEVERTLGRPDHETELLGAIAEVERAHPRLVVDLLHRKGPVESELRKAANGAQLLVVGCHHSDQAWSNRPGSVAGSLLRSPPCPLMLVGAATRRHPARPVDNQPHQVS